LDDYLTDLEYSSLALPLWAAALLWLVLFVLNHVLILKGRRLMQQQSIIAVADAAVLARASSPKIIVLQIVASLFVFVYSNYFGAYCIPILEGGWLLVNGAAFAGSLQSYLYLRAITRQGGVTGSVTISAALAFRERAFYFFGMAFFCLVGGLLLAHLALLGGGILMVSNGLGFLRRAWQAKAAPAA